MILQSVRRLYSLDTLDTRLIPSPKHHPPKVPPQDQNVGRSRDETGSRKATEYAYGEDERNTRVSPSLWGTLEFYVYYLVVGAALPVMFKVAFDVSSCKPTSWLYESISQAVNVANSFSS